MFKPLATFCLLAPWILLPFWPSASSPPLAPPAAQPADWVQLPAKPRILITNDDGIQSDGIVQLARALSVIADVTVVAPDDNRSGSSGSSTVFSEPLVVTEQQMQGIGTVYAVSGTPVDAAEFGLLHLGQDHPFDLIISGINAGLNVGEVAHYSGTVGAAMEGPAFGVPGIAISQMSRQGFQRAAEFAVVFVQKLIAEGARKGMVYSINIPDQVKLPLPVRSGPMGGRYLQVKAFAKVADDGNSKTYRAITKFDSQAPPGSDTHLVFSNQISITPLPFQWADADALQHLQQWKFDDVQ
ncbi:MAG: 5'/3'-nucleotidase SurE [Planctomycetes bacterium]|nr:5'/3'-nucleotidase SurE [Planctomycetota bacterium]